MESAIYNAFKRAIPSISRLACVRHLKARDESKLSKLLEKTGRSSADKQHALSDILKDIYGSRNGNLYEYGLAETMDIEGFNVKLDFLQMKWEGLCPNFYNWLISKRKSLFIESIIQSAREYSEIIGLYYQNDIEWRDNKMKIIY